ncbi:MAG: DUF4012 domain-containing protein [Acidimicrobiales bacterium]
MATHDLLSWRRSRLLRRAAITAADRWDRQGSIAAFVGVTSYVAGSVVSVHPTGSAFLDHFYPAVLSALVAFAGARAAKGSLLWLTVVACALSRGYLLLPATGALILGFTATLMKTKVPAAGALTAALSLQVVLRWPRVGFQGTTALLAVVAVAPLLISALRSFPDHRRRQISWTIAAFAGAATALSATAAVSALMARSQLQQGSATARSALESVKSGNVTQATSELRSAAAEMTSAETRLSSWWTDGTVVVPIVAQQRRALVTATSVARDITITAASNASAIDFSALHVTHGTVDLRAVTALSAPLGRITAALGAGSARLASVSSPWQLPPIASNIAKLQSDIASVQHSLTLASMAARDAPSLLGANGTRRYFVGFLDTAESRGLGGLLVWYGELTATDGHLSLSNFGDAGTIANELAAKGGGHLSGPPSYLARYGQFKPQDTFIDVPYSPDLPTVTDVVSQLYEQVGHKPIDGMLVLDAHSIASIISATGPLRVPGLGELTGSNTAYMLLKKQYELYPNVGDQPARKEALDAALGLAAKRLTGGSLPSAQALVRDLAPDVHTGDLLFWSVHPHDQELLYQTGLAGTFPRAQGGDLFSFITQNAANNKVDAYLERSIAYRVSYDPATGQVQSTVTAVLHNSAPSHGLSPLVIGSYAGSGLPPGSDLLWFSVYSPLLLTSARVNGSLVTLTSTPDLGVNTYSGYVDIPSGSTSKVVVDLHGTVAPGAYRLALHDQPTAIPDHTTVSVTASGKPSSAASYTWDVPAGLNLFRTFRFIH